jgi:hypothetical protein
MSDSQPPTPAKQAAPPKHAGAARAAARLEIEQVRFLHFSALTGYNGFELLPEKITPKIGFTTPTFQVHDRRVCITTTFLMRLLAQTESAKPAFDLRATAELLYRISEEGSDLEAEDIDEFARINAPFNAWPYWRELVQSALARLNLPVSPLPLFRIADAARLTVDGQSFDDQKGE